MTRLIDADAIPWDVEGIGEIPVITKEEIDQLPTVDIPIPVGESVGAIRCKDCKYCKIYYHGANSNIGMFSYECIRGLYTVSADEYCSKAERKEE